MTRDISKLESLDPIVCWDSVPDLSEEQRSVLQQLSTKLKVHGPCTLEGRANLAERDAFIAALGASRTQHMGFNGEGPSGRATVAEGVFAALGEGWTDLLLWEWPERLECGGFFFLATAVDARAAAHDDGQSDAQA